MRNSKKFVVGTWGMRVRRKLHRGNWISLARVLRVNEKTWMFTDRSMCDQGRYLRSNLASLQYEPVGAGSESRRQEETRAVTPGRRDFAWTRKSKERDGKG